PRVVGSPMANKLGLGEVGDLPAIVRRVIPDRSFRSLRAMTSPISRAQRKTASASMSFMHSPPGSRGAAGAQNEPDQGGKLIGELAVACSLKIDDGHANLGVTSYNLEMNQLSECSLTKL
ncbi:MAG: hypothetical protein ACREEV_20270, partial [Dongiaceae bacterium]